MRFAYLSPIGKRILAHRGLTHGNSGENLDENSLESVQAALAAGATYIETDLQLTKDAVPVLMHDQDLLRVAGIETKISELSLAELQKVKLHNGGTVISLEQALSEFASVRFNLDIKTLAVALPAAAVINRTAAHERVLISSFSDANRKACIAGLRQRVATSPGQSTILLAYLLHKIGATSLLRKVLSEFAALQIPTRVGPIRFAEKKFISKVRSIGPEVHFWTINDQAEAERLFGLGASGIVTDRADRLLSLAN